MIIYKPKYPQLTFTFPKEANQMAVIKKGIKKVNKGGRPANPQVAEEKKKGSPTVIFLSSKTRGLLKLATAANDTTISAVARKLLTDWARGQMKEIKKYVGSIEAAGEEDEDCLLYTS